MNENERIRKVQDEKRKNKVNGIFWEILTIISGIGSIFSLKFIGITIICAMFTIISLINFRDLENIE